MAYILTNNELVGQVADDNPALRDPSIVYDVNEIHLSGFDAWLQDLPVGTIVAKRRGYYHHWRGS